MENSELKVLSKNPLWNSMNKTVHEFLPVVVFL